MAGKRFWLVLGAALVLVVVAVGGAGSEGPPLDPRSVSPDGARGIVEVLEEFGVRVDIDSANPAPDATSALLLQDRLTLEDRTALSEWVRAGGVLVVADLRSSFASDRIGLATSSTGDCTIDALSQIVDLDIPGSTVDPGGDEYCFGDENGALVVATVQGQGTIITVGGPAAFTNQFLDEGDAAVLVLSLLAPRPTDAVVSFLGPSLVDFGEEGLNDLVAVRVQNFILQLLAAFLLYALFRMRRLGKVVKEPHPVQIEGSEIVLQAGLLSERAKDPIAVAATLRADFIDRSRRLYALSPSLSDHEFAAHIAAMTTVDTEQVMTALYTPVVDDDSLLRSTNVIVQLEHQLFGATLAGDATSTTDATATATSPTSLDHEQST